MRRTASPRVSLLLLAGLAITLSGCDFMPDREFDALEKALTLRIAEGARSASGEAVEFRFELTNGGSTSAKACLGPGRHVAYEGASSSGRTYSFVDHPGCVREIAIEPAGVLAWAETLAVPGLLDGRVELEVDVQVLNPRRCGRWGSCPAFQVKSNKVDIP